MTRRYSELFKLIRSTEPTWGLMMSPKVWRNDNATVKLARVCGLNAFLVALSSRSAESPCLFFEDQLLPFLGLAKSVAPQAIAK